MQYFVKILLIIFFLVTNLYASFRSQDEEEYIVLSAFKKCFKCFRKKIQDEENQRLLDNFYSEIEIIPEEILWKIFMNLTPREINQVSYTCKNLRKLIDEDFWYSYISSYKWKKWSENILSDRVAFANFFYEEGKIKKAAAIGLPQAAQIIDEAKKAKKNNQLSPSYINIKPYFYSKFRKIL